MSYAPRGATRAALTRRGFLIGSAALALGARNMVDARQATPARDGLSAFVDRIGPLLAMAPMMEMSGETPIPFYYADLERQMVAAGVDLPDPNVAFDSLPVGYVEASLALPLAAQAFQVGLTPEWFETFGFNPFGVSQAITLHGPPDVVTIFAGEFDVDRIETVLDASGFQRLEQEIGGSYWTVGDELDLQSPVGQLGVGTMNHAAVYEDALVFTQREADVQEVTHVVAGNVAPMLEQEIWASMIELFSPDTVGLIPASPTVMLAMGAPEEGDSATPVSDDAIVVEYLAFGVRAGAVSEPLSLVGEGTPEATPVSHLAGVPAEVEVRIRYGDAAVAEREAEAIPQRWGELASPFSDAPYAELMELHDARVHDEDASVVAVDFVSDVPNRWIQLIQTRDLAPFMPVVG